LPPEYRRADMLLIKRYRRRSLLSAIFHPSPTGTKELAAANLGFLSSNVAGYSIIIGL
jgi:hypothetical protein